MKKAFFTIISAFLPLLAMGQTPTGSLIAEKDWTGGFEGDYPMSSQFAEGQVGFVTSLPDGVAITVGTQTGELSQPEVQVLEGATLEKDHSYKVIVTAKFPCEGKLQIVMGKQDGSEHNSADVKAATDFQDVEVEFPNFAHAAEGDGSVLLHCGDFLGTTIVKKIQIIETVVVGQEFEVEGLRYKIGENNTVSVIQKADPYSGDVVIPARVVFNGVEFTVTSIGEMAFGNHCAELTSITIPSTVTSIGNKAFYEDLSKLAAVNISDLAVWCNMVIDGSYFESNPLFWAKHLFLNGEEVKDLVIPSGTTSINGGVFFGCTGLTSLKIHDGVTGIGNLAFSGCSGITTITSELTSPFEMEETVFYCSDADIFATATVIVPFGKKSVYESTAGWNKFQNIVEASVIGNEFEADGIHYIIGEENTVTVMSKAEKYSGDVVIPEQVEYNSIKYTVVSIDQSAFEGCVGITSVTIPISVTTIGKSAFEGCIGLTSIDIPNGVKIIEAGVFYSCTGLKSMVIPEGVLEIGGGAFSKCSGLTSVTIPGSVTAIYENAFYGCTSLTQIISGIKEPFAIHKNAFCADNYTAATLYVPIGTKAAYRSAAGWSQFENIVEAENIGKELEVDGVRYKIGENKTVSVIAKAEKYTGDILIPEKVEYDGSDYTVVSIAQSAFEGCVNITSVKFPNTLTKIYESAFEGCAGLSAIDLPNSLRKIDDAAFYGCSGLKNLVIPEGVTFIGRGAFSRCSGLTSLTIPSSMAAIGDYSFWECNNLIQVTTGVKEPFVISDNVFPNTVFSNATLFVPAGTMAAYQSIAGWRLFKTILNVNGIYLLTYYVDGKEYKTVEYDYGAAVTPEEEPYKEGYTFSGWNGVPTTMPARDVSVYGTYTINKYNLIYYVDGDEYKSTELNYGAEITPEEEPYRLGYTFSGWSEIPATMPATDVAIFGSFIINQYSITYIIDGEKYATVLVDYNSKIVPPTPPVKDGFEFQWEYYPETMPAYDITINGSYITTGIHSVALESGKVKIFTLDGRQVDTLRKGINIIKMADGTTKKVVIK